MPAAGVFVPVVRTWLRKEHPVWAPRFSLAGEGQLAVAVTDRCIYLPFHPKPFGFEPDPSKLCLC